MFGSEEVILRYEDVVLYATTVVNKFGIHPKEVLLVMNNWVEGSCSDIVDVCFCQ